MLLEGFVGILLVEIFVKKISEHCYMLTERQAKDIFQRHH